MNRIPFLVFCSLLSFFSYSNAEAETCREAIERIEYNYPKIRSYFLASAKALARAEAIRTNFQGGQFKVRKESASFFCNDDGLTSWQALIRVEGGNVYMLYEVSFDPETATLNYIRPWDSDDH